MSPRTHPEAPFSLARAIFLPFACFPEGDSPTLDSKEKLQKILQIVPEQQKFVRGSMLTLAEQHIETLKANARRVVETMKEDEEADAEDREIVRKAVDAMFERIKAPAAKGAKSEDFEAKPECYLAATSPAQADADVVMGGMKTMIQPRTARKVWEDLSKDLQHFVDQAASEMAAYDKHAEEVLSGYKQALDKRIGRIIDPAAAGGVNGGILRNRIVQSPIDRYEVRRMSTGMPIFGLPAAPAARTYENMDDIARRGSNSK